VKLSNAEAMPWKFVADAPTAASPYEKIALDFEQMHTIPEVPSGGIQIGAEGTTLEASTLTAAATAKAEKLDLRIRKQIGVIAGGDQEVAETLYQATKGSSLDEQLGNYVGLHNVSRVADNSVLEKELSSIRKKMNNNTATTEEANRALNLKVAFARTWGEGAGKVVDSVPNITSLADTLKVGQAIEVSATGVKAGKRKYRFNLDHGVKNKAPWNMLDSDPLESQARYIWASKLPPLPKSTLERPVIINESDIPLLEKAYREFDANMQIRGDDGVQRFVGTQDDMLRVIVGKKEELANRLHKATSEGLIGADAEVVANKLRAMTGIDFVVENLSTGTKKTRGKWMQMKDGSRKLILDREHLTNRPLHKVISTLLHEEGHSKFNVLLRVGGIPKEIYPTIRAEAVAASKKQRLEDWEGATEGTRYWRYLNKTHELMADTYSYFSQFPERLIAEAPELAKFEPFTNALRPLPKELVDSYKVRAKQLSQDEIASMVNVKSSYLGGEQSTNLADDVFALQKHSEEYTKHLKANGSIKQDAPMADAWKVPQTVKLTYDTTGFNNLSGHEIENMVSIKQKQKLYIDATDRSTATILGQEAKNFPTIDSSVIQQSANAIGAGARYLTAASSNYGTLAALTEYIGKTTIRVIEKFQTSTREALEPALYKLGQNQEAAIEWSTINATIRSIPDGYMLNDAGTALVPASIKRWEQAAAEATELGNTVPKRPQLKAPDAPLEIPLRTPEVRALAKIHIEMNGKRVESYRSIRTSQGAQYRTDSEIFYAPPVDPKEFPFFALVYDDSITGTGHVKTLYDTTEEGLKAQASKLADLPGLKVRFKKDAEDYYDAVGKFDFEKTLNDNYIDVAANKKGVSSPFFVPTDPDKIITDLLNWHMSKESGLVRETVAAKYEVPFAELRNLGDSYTRIATSKFSGKSLVKYADDIIKNPFADYIKTSLGIRKYSDYPFWINVNRMADEKLSSMYAKATGAMESAKTPEELANVNRILKDSGYKGAAYDESMDLFANHTANKGLLTSVVQKANSVLATVILRWDSLNAVNNAISANVLLGAETKAVIRAIQNSDAEAVGALSKLTRLDVPGGEGRSIFNAGQMIVNSMKKFQSTGPQMQFYRDHGYISSISDQYRKTLDDLTFNSKESVTAWNSRVDGVHKTLREAANTGEKWTGNRLAEEFNRFVAADVMKQMTDIGVAKGVITSQEQLAYINTFVNRTQGNYLAAQRPMMFQGPIGQAIGLFQTYQFNLMQQLLRHVGEGSAKDAATLLALQGTIHGMNGLPAFNAINTHIVGNASGNTEHRDLYDSLYGAVGKQAGNWLMYGVGSNWLLHPDLKVNLYTRGDINPRHLTIIPTDPSQVPIIQAGAKFFGNIFETAGKLAAGGDVSQTILQGLEHNSISRPLAGLAQTLEGLDNPEHQSYSTSKRGNVIASNDLLSLANLGRIVGGKPLDEAIALDAAFRFKAYGLVDSRRRHALGEAMKTTMIAGAEPSTEQIESFAQQYAELGGKSEQFNSWYLQLYKTANLSQANKLSQDLNGKFSTGMQKIMGGMELRDFTE